MRNQRNWTAKEVEYLQANFNKFSIEEMSRQLDRSIVSVRGKAKHIKLERLSAIATKNINQNYFTVIDKTIKAYIIGLLASDGNISSEGQLRFILSAKDKTLVQQIRDEIAPLHKIHDFPKQNAVGF